MFTAASNCGGWPEPRVYMEGQAWFTRCAGYKARSQPHKSAQRMRGFPHMPFRSATLHSPPAHLVRTGRVMISQSPLPTCT